MGNYRIDFVQTDNSCNRTEWESNASDVPSVPRLWLIVYENDRAQFKTLKSIVYSETIQPVSSKCLQYVVDDGATYSPNVRPVIDPTRTIDVSFGIGIIQINGEIIQRLW